MPKLTIRDLFDLKGKRQLAVVFVDSVEEARACEMAGIDQLVTYQEICRDIRRVAPETFLTCGIFGDHAASDADAIRAGLAAMDDGADAVYTGMSLKRVEAMAQEMIPVVGHVGLVPYRSTWFGGMRAVGRTAAEAHQVYRDTLAYQNAGAIAV